MSKKEWEDQNIKGYTFNTPDLSLISADQLKKALVVVDGIVQSERGFLSIDSNLILKSKIEELSGCHREHHYFAQVPVAWFLGSSNHGYTSFYLVMEKWIYEPVVGV